MADAAMLRREARRRKILENSQNRLQLITGRTQETNKQEPLPSSKPEIEEIVAETASVHSEHCHSSLIPNGALFNEADLSRLLQSNHIDQTTPDNLIDTLTSLSLPNNNDVLKPVTLWEKLTASKYDIVLVSIAMQILFILSSVPAEITYFFFPIIVYIVTKFIFIPLKPHSKLGGLLMLLQSLPQIRVQKLVSLAQYTLAFIEDISIYLFCTICMQVLWLTLINNTAI